MFDIVVSGGFVVDGTGAPGRNADYLDLLDELRPAVNVATLVPNGNLRIAAVDDVARPAMASETRDMARLLEAALDAGAFGLSTGLEYPPEHHASEEEIIELHTYGFGLPAGPGRGRPCR